MSSCIIDENIAILVLLIRFARLYIRADDFYNCCSRSESLTGIREDSLSAALESSHEANLCRAVAQSVASAFEWAICRDSPST
jgi:hypothetical protein